MSEQRWVLGPGAVGARTIKGSVSTAITVVGGARDRLGDAIFDPSSLYEVLGLARFIGRAELIAKIDAYIARHRSGYVLIRGEAGVGKSTWPRIWCGVGTAFITSPALRERAHPSRPGAASPLN